jgi:glutathione S-transferase
MYLVEKGLDPAALAARGMSLELVDVDIGKGEHRGAELVALHPLAQLPVLRLDDGRVLAESIAICRWFEEQIPEPPLFGKGAWGRAQVEMWNRLAELELLVPVSLANRHGHAFWKDRVEQVPAFAAQAVAQIKARMAWLDRELGTRRWLAGDELSVADLTAVCALDFGKLSGVRVTPELPNLRRWYDELGARPSAKA